MKLKTVAISFLLSLSLSPALAFQNFFSFGNQFPGVDSTVLSTPLINQDSFTFYDQLEKHFIVIRNINNPAFLKIAVLNLNYKVVKIVKAPSSAFKRAFSIEDVSFYPTQISTDNKTQAGMIIIETNKGNIIFNLVTLKADFIEFKDSFFESPKNTEIEFIELTEPSFL